MFKKKIRKAMRISKVYYLFNLFYQKELLILGNKNYLN